MIKLEVEIKDDKFLYTYHVGSSEHSSSQELCADTLATFTALLQLCSRHFEFKHKEWERKTIEKEYLKKLQSGT